MADPQPVLEDMFFREKPAKVMLAMKSAKGPVYATILSKEADCTYSHTIKILNVMRDLGLVKFEKKGRIKTVTLTDDGWEVAHNLEAVYKKLYTLEEKVAKNNEKKKK